MLLEICANSYQSAVNAQEAGAHRIELCNELSIGGITPSYGLIKQVVTALYIPVYVLIRPRSGNFDYSDDEFEVMKSDIQVCKDLGVQGIVSGVLKEDNTIDIKRTQTLLEWTYPLPFTFHRAFDCVPNPKQTLETLISLGVNRVLTSGQQTKAIDGIELLSKMKELSGNKMVILAGGGINPENAADFKKAGFDEIHASASKLVSNAASEYFGNTPQTVSDIKTIQNILNAIQ